MTAKVYLAVGPVGPQCHLGTGVVIKVATGTSNDRLTLKLKNVQISPDPNKQTKPNLLQTRLQQIPERMRRTEDSATAAKL